MTLKIKRVVSEKEIILKKKRTNCLLNPINIFKLALYRQPSSPFILKINELHFKSKHCVTVTHGMKDIKHFIRHTSSDHFFEHFKTGL